METQELLIIETADLSLFIKGLPYDRKYTNLRQYRKQVELEKETMVIRVHGEQMEAADVLNVETGELEFVQSNKLAPIFFENGIYQLVLTPKREKQIQFYHEHPGIRNSISPVGTSGILMGNLQFTNEVGLTNFSFYSGKEKLLEVTLEIFPSKLSYKEDYRKLLEEVNDEVYNLAFHFIKKTYLNASSILSENPSPTEFFRLLEHYFLAFEKAIRKIEQQPHHQLNTEHELVRGDRIKRLDSKGRQFLRKHPQVFEDSPIGFSIKGRTFLPTKGINTNKRLSFNTLENRFVKWMIERLLHKLTDLKQRVIKRDTRFQVEVDEILVNRITYMVKQLEKFLQKSFWKEIGSIDRTVLNMVMQSKAGYREAYKIYLIVSRGLSLQGELYKMSVKDVATLYEYWTYLKLGQILRKNYVMENQNIVKTRQGALFVDLDQTSNATQVFRHPQTHERIKLSFQKNSGKLPTVAQKPDIMLEVQKKGVSYSYNYIFDAKYRIDFGQEYSQNGPGPMEEDINTMHRYRDAHVVRKRQGSYERHAFGAYVLFPWYDEENYELHPFYKSIDEVNIGGLPFLPNATKLVERIVDRLIESNPEDLQNEGILPQGSVAYWRSNLDETVLIGSVNNKDDYVEFKKNGHYRIKANNLKEGWQNARFLALYVTQEVTKDSTAENGIHFYGEIKNVQVIQLLNDVYIEFKIEKWESLSTTIRPVGYGIQSYLLTTMNLLKEVAELPELYMKFGEERKLWRMLRRLSTNVRTNLDQKLVDQARKIQAYQIGFYSLVLDVGIRQIHILYNDELILYIPMEQLKKQPASVFKMIKETIFQ